MIQRKRSGIFSCTYKTSVHNIIQIILRISSKFYDKLWKLIVPGFKYCSYLRIDEILFSTLSLSSRGSLRDATCPLLISVPTNSAAVSSSSFPYMHAYQSTILKPLLCKIVTNLCKITTI